MLSIMVSSGVERQPDNPSLFDGGTYLRGRRRVGCGDNMSWNPNEAVGWLALAPTQELLL